MNLKDSKKNWDLWGKTDPFWAILTNKDKRDSRWQKADFFATGRQEIENLMRDLDLRKLRVKRRMALDFGCGVGRLTQPLAEYFERVRGVDIAPSMIELAKKYNTHGNRCVYYANAENHLRIFPDNHFDFIISKITLQHIEPPDTKNYLKEFIRILAPEGLLTFQLPSGPSEILKQYQQKHALRTRIKNAIPKKILETMHKIKYHKTPLIEIYGINRSEITDLIKRDGGKIIAVESDHSAGPNWVGYQYIITK